MACVSPGHEKDQDDFRISSGNENIVALVFNEDNEEGELVVEVQRKDLENQSIWNQMKEIAVFTGPATGLWICGPLMSLIDTAVIGQGSSIELAALGNSLKFLLDF